MIQLNLLPDVKLEYIKARRLRRTITSVAMFVTIGSVVLLLILLALGFAQKARISNVDKSIEDRSRQLKGKKDINKVLTVQNQLNSLTQLHSEKPAVANLFTYLNQTTPPKVSISNLHIDFTDEGGYKLTITGSADALSNVNKYVDTLKFTKFVTDQDETEKNAFSNVVLTSFGVSGGQATPGQAASYTIDLNYDPVIFETTQKVTLKVPSQTTTRSSVDAPSELFQSGGTQ